MSCGRIFAHSVSSPDALCGSCDTGTDPPDGVGSLPSSPISEVEHDELTIEEHLAGSNRMITSPTAISSAWS